MKNNNISIESQDKKDVMTLSTHNGTEESRQRAIYHLITDEDYDENKEKLIQERMNNFAELELDLMTDEMKAIVKANLIVYIPETFVCFRVYKQDENGKLDPVSVGSEVDNSFPENKEVEETTLVESI
jgi:hypothetical protein